MIEQDKDTLRNTRHNQITVMASAQLDSGGHSKKDMKMNNNPDQADPSQSD